jgi:uncharacterized protein
MSSETPSTAVAESIPDPPRAAATGEPRPVGADERLTLIDVLRGFALGGVFLSNLYIWFSGRVFESMKEMKDPANMAAGLAVHVFVFGKFISLFAFLFGLGFTLQMGRAEERGAPAGRLYARRMLVLFLLGAAHAAAIWYGDILHVYALFGFTLLLFFRRRSERALLGLGLALALLASPAGELAVEFLPRLWRSPEAAVAGGQAAADAGDAWKAQVLADFTSGSYLAVVRANATVYREMFFRPAILGAHVSVLGRFLLGACAGRRRLLHDVPAHRRFFRRLLGWGLLAGVIGNVVNTGLRILAMREMIDRGGLLWKLAGPVMAEIGALGLAAFYLAAIALLFQRARWRRALSLLAPAGQMALTNYLCQSVIGVLLFCGVGLGLMGKVSGPLSIALVVGIFSLQILGSHLWLARFRFGPVEWVWRSLTYGKAQPMRRWAGSAAP